VTPAFVILGASLAGSTAAATLRQEGFDGEIVLIGDEPLPPYERPALSKQYLRGELPADKLLVRPLAFYGEARVTTLFGARATRIAPAERAVELQDGRRVRYDKLLIATGVRTRRPPIPGLDRPGVFSLRTRGDADAIRAEIRPGRRAVVVGMGFIGCEVAASLRHEGVEVVGVHPSPTPLFHALGRDVGLVIADVHREHGVDVILGDRVAAFEGDSRVRRAVLQGGRAVACDFAVVGAGVEPEAELAAGTGIDTANGVLVDEQCRTAVDGIFAAGDVANHFHPLHGRRMRVEHWRNAIDQGAAAARSMLGRQEPYAPVHWFWSDQYDVNLQYAGSHVPGDRLVVRGSLDRRDFIGFYLAENRIDAAVAINRGKDLRRAMPLIKARAVVDPALLQDESIDLRNCGHR
jgi:3-phenylpropionate/trans-cinnamate dioxygenase ferredoxin reductase subunit